MSDTSVTIVRFRDPRPPHGAVLTVIAPAIKYAFKVRKTGTASFFIARSDPNIISSLASIIANEPPMVTIERPDGYMPWVGFVTQYDAAQKDPYATFLCADHSWRLAAPHGARTRKNQFYKTASGRVIKDVFRDMEDRAEPAPFLKYDDVIDGPLANYEVRADYGLDLLEEIAKQANYEWGFSYNVSPSQVEAHLNWVQRLGKDRRNEEVWQEQKHFTDARYTLTYANGIRSAIAVGGSGPFAQRPAVVVNQSGSAEVSAYKKTPVSAYGLGGTRSAVTEQITDANVLRQKAVQMHEAPEFAVEQIALRLFEDAIDMSRFGIGDIRTIRLSTTSLGSGIERTVRIIGLQFVPDTHEVEVETQVLL